MPPLSMLELDAAEASAKKELVEPCIDENVLFWLLLGVELVAFLRMLEKLRFPPSLLCFFPGLDMPLSYDWSKYLL